MTAADISTVLRILRKEVARYDETAVGRISRRQDPFEILVSTVISARTKDEVTAEASSRLFARADSPKRILRLSESEIGRLIYPAGFYRTKAKHIRALSRMLLDRYGGKVPGDMDSLLSLPGVGRKTANLVLGLGFGIPSICVDTHVHRISNRLGYVTTKTPEETEFALRKKLPERYWIEYNGLCVTYGRNICRPIGPHCRDCRLRNYCDFGRKEKPAISEHA